MQWVE